MQPVKVTVRHSVSKKRGRPSNHGIRRMTMKAGDRFKRRGQRYQCTGRFSYEIPARFVWVYELRSECAECGQAFTCTGSASQIKNRELRRRCDHCKTYGPVHPRKQTARGRAGKRRPRRKRAALKIALTCVAKS